MTTCFGIAGVLVAVLMIFLGFPPQDMIIILLVTIALNQGDSK